MPQIFSPGWLFLFLFVMAICVLRILVKAREIHGMSGKGKPVLPVAPLVKESPPLDEDGKGTDSLVEPDRLIKSGQYAGAVTLLTPMLEDLSPVENRELMGKIQYRLGACQRRIGSAETSSASLLRSGEALREAVSLFSPERLRSSKIRATSELAGLYEDLAKRQNPVENLTLAWTTWDAAVTTARELSLAPQEAAFLSRSASAVRQLASHTDRQGNLGKAANIYGEALAVPDAFPDPDSLLEKAVILKMLGDIRVELSGIEKRALNLTGAVSAYDEALNVMTSEKHPKERSATLLDIGRVLLDIYDTEHSPAHLRKALRSLREAVDLLKSGDDRIRKGLSMALLGDALVRYADVRDPEENLDRAGRLYETALGFLKKSEDASYRERIKERLRKTVEKREKVKG